MAHAAAITFKEFRHRYNSEDACRAELFRLRFPNGLYTLNVAAWNTILFKAGIPASVVPAGTRLLLPPERSCTAHTCP